jgi:hypothetical protein
VKFEKGQWVVVRRATGDCQLSTDERHQVEDVTDSLVKLIDWRGWWAHDRFELSENQLGPVDGSAEPKFKPNQLVRAVKDWSDPTHESLRIRKGDFFHVSATMGNTISLAEKPRNAWYFEEQFEEVKAAPHQREDERLAPLREAVAELAQALLDTHERLGKTVMPDREGWAWYDALKKHAPEFLPKYRCKGILRRDRVAPGISGDWYLRCDKDAPHEGKIHEGGGVSWGDSAVGASYLVEGTDV